MAVFCVAGHIALAKIHQYRLLVRENPHQLSRASRKKSSIRLMVCQEAEHIRQEALSSLLPDGILHRVSEASTWIPHPAPLVKVVILFLFALYTKAT